MTIRFSQHAENGQFEVADDCLRIGGQSITAVAAKIGRTPFYAYDRQLIDRRIALLRTHLPRTVHVHFAMKANPMPAVVEHIAPQVDGLDVASAGELTVALTTATRPDLISFAGPGKTRAELEAAVAAGIVLNVESENELRALGEIARARGVRPKIAIRVNPDFELKTSGMKMSGGPKQFGIDAECVPDVLRNLAAIPHEFMGFHIFSGSQNLRVEAIQEAQQKAVELGIALAAFAPTPVRTLNIGGGFGIPYFPGEQPLDLAPIGATLGELERRTAAALPGARLIVELGRYIVGEAGIYVCRVLDRKLSRGQIFLVTDGGLHHHLAASGNFGQVLRKNYPVIVGNRVVGGARETVSVVGPLCTPLDLLADRMEMAKADVGDLIVVFQSGAYGLTASPIHFLSHPSPAEILL